MTHQEHVEAYLRRHPGVFFCSACVAHEINTTADIGRSITWTLQALPGYEMRGSKCVTCLRGKRTIRYVGGHGVVGATARVVLFMLTNTDIYLCDACLAFATEIGLADVRRVTGSIAPLAEFDRTTGACTVCSRETDVTAALHTDEGVDGANQIVTGTVPYRGWRIDLLSYRIADGWRPFVLIKGMLGAAMQDAPSVLWSVVRTKAEADAEALREAKAWVDTRSPA